MERKGFFLESKLQPPTQSSNFLIRERLLERLSQIRERLVVVSAGMGYGKTVLLAQFARLHPGGCAWYHLNETDNDLMSFAQYLSESIAKAVPEFGINFDAHLTLEYGETPEHDWIMVQGLAAEFCQQLRLLQGRELWAVLDDFHVITNEHIIQFLQLLLDNQPGELWLILCMKSVPPSFCARYLLERKAVLVGAEQLAFQEEETRKLIEDYAQPRNLDRVAAAVQKYTEGWPAGISFTMLYFSQRQYTMSEEDVEHVCQQSYLQDYFLHELYRKLPYELQHFLTATSVLVYLRPNVCNALAGVDNAASQLSWLSKENMFVLRLPGSDQIYRYHNLFKNFLLGQLPSSRRRRLLEQASDFYLRTTDRALAVEYAIECGDPERLQNALEAAGSDALEKGQVDTVGRWLEEHQAAGISSSPEILLLEGQYHERAGDFASALEYARQVIEEYPVHTKEITMLKAKLLWARLLREQSQFQESLEMVEEILPKLRGGTTAQRELRSQAQKLRMYALLDLEQFDRALSIALEYLDGRGRSPEEREHIWYREMATLCYFAMGEYRRAMQMYVLLSADGNGISIAPYIHLYQAAIGRVCEAEEGLRQVMKERPDRLSRHVIQNQWFIKAIVDRIAESEGIAPLEGLQGYWGQSRMEAGYFNRKNPVYILWRALQREPMTAAEEDALNHLESSAFPLAQVAAKWLAVRSRIRRGDVGRALELCRMARNSRRNSGGELSKNMFQAFLTMEEAMLLRPEQPREAAAMIDEIRPYWLENNLVCPGHTQQERELLAELLAGQEELPVVQTVQKLPLQPLPVARVKVQCFGRFQVFLPDGQELLWRTRKAQGLFAYLFHHNGAAVERDLLVDILWPQAAPGNGTSLLHTSLYSIRKVLAPYGLDQLICREKKGYRMDMAMVESSRELMDQFCREGQGGTDLTKVYQGSYLEDIDGVWAEDTRARYAGAFLRFCRQRARELMGREDYQGAVQCLSFARNQEPYDEEVAAMLIRGYSLLGEMKNAMGVYNRLKDTLHSDMGVEPGAEVTRVYRECLLKRLSSGR